jgi:transposase
MTTEMEFAAFVGIDWADEEHAVCLRATGSSKLEESILRQRTEDIEKWALGLRERFGGRPIAVCLEQSRGSLIYSLMNYDFLLLFPVNPKQAARYREALAPSGHKDDPFDARMICRFVGEHHDHLTRLRPDDPVTQGLKLLNEGRRGWVNNRTAAGNHLQQRLKEVYPLALELAGQSIFLPWFLTLLAKFPSQRQLCRASPRQLARFLRPLRRQAEAEPDPRIALIRAAKPLDISEAILSAGTLAIVHLVNVIAELNKAVDDYDRQIATLMAKHPEAELFTSLPGAGEALAPRLAAAWGTDRERFESAEQVATWSGIAPVMKRSGKTCVVAQRWICPKFLKQTFHEFARCSIRQSGWARACYKMLIQRGHKHNAAVRALAFKWIRIMFRCWKDRVPYNEEVHLHGLRQSNSPVLAFLEVGKNAANA